MIYLFLSIILSHSGISLFFMLLLFSVTTNDFSSQTHANGIKTLSLHGKAIVNDEKLLVKYGFRSKHKKYGRSQKRFKRTSNDGFCCDMFCPYSSMRLTYTLLARRPMEVMPDDASRSNSRSSFTATVCERPVSSM